MLPSALLSSVVVVVVASGVSAQSTPSLTLSTVIPSASSNPPSSPLPPQVAVPPKQSWCPSDIFCAGPLLQTLNVAQLFVDPKTIVDKPTNASPSSVLSTFNALNNGAPANASVEQVIEFIEDEFKGEGLELEGLALQEFNPNPTFLGNISDSLVKAFTQTVHGFWPQLIRGTNRSTLCDGSSCESSLIPLNHTFVVPGGRFREQYYWDSFWIVEGLLESELYGTVNDTLQNFMDELETIGFIPNGGRIYYLNRSQPPLFIQMLSRYVNVTGDTSILSRALPLAEKELTWWRTNRSLNITIPSSSSQNTTTHLLYRYSVTNSAPRPESYLTDYLTANPNGTINGILNETARSELYAELASGAETGMDYTARWVRGLNDRSVNVTNGQVEVGAQKTDWTLRDLVVRDTIPVDLNSILYKNHLLMAQLYSLSNSSSPNRVTQHAQSAESLREAILATFWNPSKLAFYDYSLSQQSQLTLFSAAAFYPYWAGIYPPELLSDSSIPTSSTGGNNAFKAFSSVNLVIRRWNGTFPTTFMTVGGSVTGLQWDAPNAWPPHQYIVLQALRGLREVASAAGISGNVTSTNLASFTGSGSSNSSSSFDLIPPGQLGLTEDELTLQPISASQNATGDPGVVSNVGNAPTGEGEGGEGWVQQLERELANRYVASALCSWHATGGSIPNVLPRLSDQELNVTQSVGNTGNMFEKFSNLDIDSAGRGGEYTVQAGFGWTNGVLLWVASNYGDVLVAPQCPDLLQSAEATSGSSSSSGSSSGTSSGATATETGNGNGATSITTTVTTTMLMGVVGIGMMFLVPNFV